MVFEVGACEVSFASQQFCVLGTIYLGTGVGQTEKIPGDCALQSVQCSHTYWEQRRLEICPFIQFVK